MPPSSTPDAAQDPRPAPAQWEGTGGPLGAPGSPPGRAVGGSRSFAVVAAWTTLAVGSACGLAWLAPLEYGTGRWLGLAVGLAAVVPGLIDSYVVLSVLTARDRAWSLPIAGVSGLVGQLHKAGVLPETDKAVKAWVAALAAVLAVAVTARLKPLVMEVVRAERERLTAAQRSLEDAAKAERQDAVRLAEANADAERARLETANAQAERERIRAEREADAAAANTPAPRANTAPDQRVRRTSDPEAAGVYATWLAREGSPDPMSNKDLAGLLGISTDAARVRANRWRTKANAPERTAAEANGATA